MISFTVMAIVFGVVFLAELPDKTALAGLMLGTRYRASYVFAGVAAAFAVHVALAVAGGQRADPAAAPARAGAWWACSSSRGAAVLLLKKDEDDEETVKAPRTSPSGRSPGRASCSSWSPSSAT